MAGKNGKKRVFISWIGNTDLNNCTNKNINDRGPLLSTLEHCVSEIGFFNKIILMYSDMDEEKLNLLKNSVVEINRNKGECVLEHCNVNPVDPKSIYDEEIDVLSRRHPVKGDSLFYGLTSGTPAMYAMQLLISQQHFGGHVYYSSRPSFRVGESIPRAFRVSLPACLATLCADPAPTAGFTPEVNRKVFQQIEKNIARMNVGVLIVGETGVGKTQLAKYIHENSGERAAYDMVSLNCAEVAGDHNLMRSELFGHVKGAFTGATENKRGKFALADKGTLFLDEIGEIPLPLQSLLLKALDDGVITPLGSNNPVKIDVRIIAATNKDLVKEVEEGRFRRDLYYRLAQYTPYLAPVRDYADDDKDTLLDTLLAEINSEYFQDGTTRRSLTAEARKALKKYSWPGNIREMKFRLTSICLLSEQEVQEKDVLEQISIPMSGSTTKGDDWFKEVVSMGVDQWIKNQKVITMQRALQDTKTDAEAAELLGLPASTFNNWKKKLMDTNSR